MFWICGICRQDADNDDEQSKKAAFSDISAAPDELEMLRGIDHSHPKETVEQHAAAAVAAAAQTATAAAVAAENESSDPKAAMPPAMSPQQGSTAAGGMEYQPNAIPVGEVRLCPISGLNTLQGVCPFAKPKKKPKSGDKLPKLQLKLDLSWEEGASKVSIAVRPHLMDFWAALELPDTSSKEEIRQQYRRLMLIHHPDKNLDDPEGASKRFEKIKEAYDALKDTDGELGFAWDEHQDKQRVMTGEEAIQQFGKLGLEACEQQPLEAIQLRHMVKMATDVKALLFTSEKNGDGGSMNELWLDALCIDEKSGADHIVKIYRRGASGREPEGEPPE